MSEKVIRLPSWVEIEEIDSLILEYFGNAFEDKDWIKMEIDVHRRIGKSTQIVTSWKWQLYFGNEIEVIENFDINMRRLIWKVLKRSRSEVTRITISKAGTVKLEEFL